MSGILDSLRIVNQYAIDAVRGIWNTGAQLLNWLKEPRAAERRYETVLGKAIAAILLILTILGVAYGIVSFSQSRISNRIAAESLVAAQQSNFLAAKDYCQQEVREHSSELEALRDRCADKMDHC